jgi:hypothetical protein
MNKRQKEKKTKQIFYKYFVPEEDDDMCPEMFRDFYQDAEEEFSIHFEELTGKESVEEISDRQYDTIVRMFAFRNYLYSKKEMAWQNRIIKLPAGRKIHVWLNYGEEPPVWDLFDKEDNYNCGTKQEVFDLLTEEEQKIFVMHKYFQKLLDFFFIYKAQDFPASSN